MSIAILGYIQYFAAMCYIAATASHYYFQIILLSSFIAGCMGGFNSFNMAIFSYAADITSACPADRGQYFAYLEATNTLAHIVAPLTSGLWAQSKGFVEPLGFAAGLCLVAFLWVNCVLPEAPQLLSSAAITLDPLKTFRNLMFIYTYSSSSASSLSSKTLHSNISLPFTANFLYFFAYMVEKAVYVVYQKHVFHFDSGWIGGIDSYQSLLSAVSMISLPAIARRAGVEGGISEQILLALGYAGRAAFYLMYPLIPPYPSHSTKPALTALSTVLIFTGPISPLSRSLITNSVSAAHQADIQASFSALQAACLLLSTLGSLLYACTVTISITAAGTVWYVCGGLLLGSLLLSITHYRNRIRNTYPPYADTNRAAYTGITEDDSFYAPHTGPRTQSINRDRIIDDETGGTGMTQALLTAPWPLQEGT